MMTHLKKHIPKEGKGTHYIIRVSNGGPFWMHIQVPSKYTLEHIDEFLRNKWLDCCGHLSCFTICEVEYERIIDPTLKSDRESMNQKISEILDDGMSFTHEYDYGTTTKLILKVKAANVPPISVSDKNKISVLSIHDPVRFICDTCGAVATKVCAYCGIDGEDSLLCTTCLKLHDCTSEDKDAAMNLVQSPRVGMCAYDFETII